MTDSTSTWIRISMNNTTTDSSLFCPVVRRLAVLGSLWTMIVQAHPISEDPKASPLRDWSVADSIAVRYFVADHNTGMANWPIDQGNPIVFSPDGRWMFFTTYHGDLATDSKVYEVWVFSVKTIREALESELATAPPIVQPFRILSFKTKGDGPAVFKTRWTEDSRALVMIGTRDENPKKQVYRLELEDGTFKPLTDAQDDVAAYTLARNSIVFATYRRVPFEKPPPDYPFTLVTNQRIEQALRTYLGTEGMIYGGMAGHPTRPLFSGERVDSRLLQSISPDGTKAVVGLMELVHPNWTKYRELETADVWSGAIRAPQLFRIDLETGASEPILDAPLGIVTSVGKALQRNVKPDVLWSDDQSKVILVNTAIPLGGSGGPADSQAYIVSYDWRSQTWEILEPLEAVETSTDSKSNLIRQVARVGWLKPGIELLVRHHYADGSPAPGTIYSLLEGKWQARTAAAAIDIPSAGVASPADMRVWIRQDANTPPEAVAALGKREILLTSPDTALSGVWRAPAETVEWKELDGSVGKGLLMLPKRSDRSPPPLVIQCYYYLPHLFRPDGAFPCGFAAQALVAQGMAVLQLDIPTVSAAGFAENTIFVQRVDAAVASLAARGLINPALVGIMGFSRGGYLTYYLATHPERTAISAAAILDGWKADYTSYVRSRVTENGAVPDYERKYGGSFWNAKSQWLEHSPNFLADRLRTPLFVTTNGGTMGAAIWEAETLAACEINRRPIEMVSYEGQHQLARPRQGHAAMSMVVDWMNFWLVDRIPADSERAARWAILRKQQDEVLKTAPPPKGKWVFVPEESSGTNQEEKNAAAVPKH